uniref:Uncharacterized protein n=1 Tax=Thalassionema nitzschioides TaxID=33649 RepID=A0A6T5YE55_9STRA|mmetsp:Transcript_8934/g.7373  ORF Transcript_8934/g.7373 Transcript_8934/m.7373 type:complete len:158 (+) Transcript_8934:62-535(+)
MSHASFVRLAGNVPLPLFGSLSTFTAWGSNAARKFPAAAGWAFPGIVGGLWFVWPAVDQEWKEEMGLARKVVPPGSAPAPKPVELDDSAKAAIANAHKAEGGHTPTETDIQIGKELRMGVTTSLEKEWEAFNDKAIRPGEDDDDDDDDDEDDDDEDE